MSAHNTIWYSDINSQKITSEMLHDAAHFYVVSMYEYVMKGATRIVNDTGIARYTR